MQEINKHVSGEEKKNKANGEVNTNCAKTINQGLPPRKLCQLSKRGNQIQLL